MPREVAVSPRVLITPGVGRAGPLGVFGVGGARIHQRDVGFTAGEL